MTPAHPDPTAARGVVSLTSPHPFAETVQRLLAAFASRGVKVFAKIDQQAEALAVGLTMPPTVLIVFGSPRAGTPLMLSNPQSGIDLPLKVLVSETEPGHVVVVFNAADYIIQRHSLPAELAPILASAERLIADALVR